MARRTIGGPYSYSYGLSSSYSTDNSPSYHSEYISNRESNYRDSGPRDFGPRDSGPRDSGPRDSGPRDSGPRDSGPRDSSGYEAPQTYGPELVNAREEFQGKKLYSTLERLNSGSNSEGASEEMMRLFPPPAKRFCPISDKPVYKNGVCIPRQDALLVEMVLTDKATLKAQLDITKQPIVGLNFVNEYIDPEGGMRVYECSLCKTYRTVNTMMEHITGYNHRVNYIHKQFPSEVKMFLLPDGRTKNRNRALMTIASKRCSELELVYGRGDVTVYNEKPKIPEGALDASESDTLPEDKKLDELRKDIKKYTDLKIETAEEFRAVRSLTSALTHAMCEYKYIQEQTEQAQQDD